MKKMFEEYVYALYDISQGEDFKECGLFTTEKDALLAANFLHSTGKIDSYDIRKTHLHSSYDGWRVYKNSKAND